MSDSKTKKRSSRKSSSKKQQEMDVFDEERAEMASSTTSLAKEDKPVTFGQFRLVSTLVMILLCMNVAICIVALIVGLQVKGQVDDVEAKVNRILVLLPEEDSIPSTIAATTVAANNVMATQPQP